MSDDKTTVEHCFEQLRPVLMDITRLIKTAPCNQAGLAVMAAAHMFAIAGAAMGKDTYTNAREVADIIVNVMRDAAPTLRVVK